MKIKERLQKLHDEGYKVKHKLLGTVEMDEMDIVRVRGVKPNESIEKYCDFLYADKLTKSNVLQHMDNDLLEKEIIHEETWMLGVDCTLDMYVNID